MIKLEKLSMPAASMGELNPMPDIKNVSYIHAGYEMTDKIREDEKTYLGKGMIPTMLPYLIQDGYDRNKKMRTFTTVVLENSKLKATFLPELGGRLRSLFDKEKNKEILYVNSVFQPGNLGLRNAWFSGGVEFNVGIKGHTPLTCSPLWCSVDTCKDGGEILRLYEFERIRGVVYSVSAYLPEDSNVLYIKCKIENKSNDEKYMYWWTNMNVTQTKGTRVLVPAEESFLSFYNEDHYLLDKASIPVDKGLDVTYPAQIPSSRDFFYKIPEDHYKWIATANEEGFGLLQCSTRKLKGRKLFLWGKGRGGKHWNEWLSEEGSSNLEIQAGLAHTQLEHIPMKGKTTWEWVEAFTALERDPAVMHGEYKDALKDVEDYMLSRIGNPNELTFPDDSEVVSSKIVHKGSDWGAIEESVRGERISDLFLFPKQTDAETEEWTELLNTGAFPEPDIQTAPKSYVKGKFWLDKLEAVSDKNWYVYLHIGVVKYEMGDVDGAKKAWEESCKIKKSPWALRNLSMIYKNELGNIEEGRNYILAAFELKKDNPSLTIEVAAQLTSDGNDELWLQIYDSLSDEMKEIGRLRLYRAVALIHLSRLDEAAEIVNEDFVMSDIKEGELSISHLWFVLYRRIYAREIGKEYDENDKQLIAEADEKYPLPKSLDFRMHD